MSIISQTRQLSKRFKLVSANHKDAYELMREKEWFILNYSTQKGRRAKRRRKQSESRF